MEYQITKISINKESCLSLINEIQAKIEIDGDFTAMDKRPQEFEFKSDDEKIDIFVKCGTYSEYERQYPNDGPGGVYCTYRSASIDISMYSSDSGDEIEWTDEIDIIERLEKELSI